GRGSTCNFPSHFGWPAKRAARSRRRRIIAPMKAVRVDADGGVSVVEVPEPSIGPGEALMRSHVAGICGSDLLDWYVRKKVGSILGHEVSGEIVAVGDGVAELAPGDRVAPHHHAPCLACEACASGRYVHCAAWRGWGAGPPRGRSAA